MDREISMMWITVPAGDLEVALQQQSNLKVWQLEFGSQIKT